MNDKTPRFEMTREQLAALGQGSVAYVRSIDADKVRGMIGNEATIPANSTLFCLYLADGTPVSISGSREAAIASAHQHDLTPLAVH
jgi:hypothetical protein